MATENTQSQMRKGVLEYCVLSVIARGEIYSSDIIDMLTNAKLLVAEGTLYPLLSRLKNSGLVTYKWVESTQGPPRKYFQITETGIQYLKELDANWEELILTVKNLKTTPK
ncbi:MAG: PadR family transcriptional regulator [Bacteroidetes bacterium]|nr:PadR family transcriptional regulator [Bacteroidota bacterium]